MVTPDTTAAATSAPADSPTATKAAKATKPAGNAAPSGGAADSPAAGKAPSESATKAASKSAPAKPPAKAAAKAAAKPSEAAPSKKDDKVDVDTFAAAQAAEAGLEAAKVEAAKAPSKSETESAKGEGRSEPAKPNKPTAPVQPVWVAPAPSADADSERDIIPPVIGTPSAGKAPEKSVDAFGSPLTVPSGMAGEALPENNGSSNGSDPGSGREVLVGEIVAGDAVTSRPTNGSGNTDEERDTPTLP